jgi:prepilin-type N-terminal cleavage/methylation domain-containing protein
MKKAFRAFTIIELLVVMAIFSVISLLILANHSKFNSSVLLGSLAYNIALSIREAQVYGLSVQTFNADFQVGYGIHVTTGTQYLFFADTNASDRYESATDSILQTYSVGQGHTIERFCGVKTDGSEECSDSATPITHLDILFFRPNPDAIISADNPGLYSGGKIVVASPSGETRTITVESTGQISVSSQ